MSESNQEFVDLTLKLTSTVCRATAITKKIEALKASRDYHQDAVEKDQVAIQELMRMLLELFT